MVAVEQAEGFLLPTLQAMSKILSSISNFQCEVGAIGTSILWIEINAERNVGFSVSRVSTRVTRFLSEHNQVIGSAGQFVNSQTRRWAGLPHSSPHPELEHVLPTGPRQIQVRVRSLLPKAFT